VRLAVEKINGHTEESVLSLTAIVAQAKELDLMDSPIIQSCVAKVDKYTKGVEFSRVISSPALISTLSFSEINAGIEILKELSDVIPNAESTILMAVEHKRVVEYELNHVLRPLQDHFADCLVLLDNKSGTLVNKSSIHANVFDRVAQLQNLVLAHTGKKFNCTDLGLLLEDCAVFVHFMVHFVATFNARGATEYLKAPSLHPHGDLLRGQLLEFRMWTDLHMSAVYLRQQLLVGAVPRSDTGEEAAPTVENLERLLSPLKELEAPPPVYISIIDVTVTIIEVIAVDSDLT
jgi:hypothetical protein